MTIMPKFEEPGYYIRYYGARIDKPAEEPEKKFRYIHLLEREGPLKYPYTFASVAVGSKTDAFTFKELDPSTEHIYQAYLGVVPGVQVYVWHRYDEKILKWDEKIEDINEDDVANITQDESPYDAPSFEIWIAPGKRYPALVCKNVTDRLYQGGASIKPKIIWIVSKFTFEHVIDPELLDKLVKQKIPSEPITFGGRI